MDQPCNFGVTVGVLGYVNSCKRGISTGLDRKIGAGTNTDLKINRVGDPVSEKRGGGVYNIVSKLKLKTVRINQIAQFSFLTILCNFIITICISLENEEKTKNKYRYVNIAKFTSYL